MTDPTPLAPEEDDASFEPKTCVVGGGDAANDPGRRATGTRPHVAEGESVEDDGLALSDPLAAAFEKAALQYMSGVGSESKHEADVRIARYGVLRWAAAKARRHAALPSRDQLGELEAWLETKIVRADKDALAAVFSIRRVTAARNQAAAFRAVLQRIREGRSDG